MKWNLSTFVSTAFSLTFKNHLWHSALHLQLNCEIPETQSCMEIRIRPICGSSFSVSTVHCVTVCVTTDESRLSDIYWIDFCDILFGFFIHLCECIQYILTMILRTLRVCFFSFSTTLDGRKNRENANLWTHFQMATSSENKWILMCCLPNCSEICLWFWYWLPNFLYPVYSTEWPRNWFLFVCLFVCIGKQECLYWQVFMSMSLYVLWCSVAVWMWKRHIKRGAMRSPGWLNTRCYLHLP